MNDQPNPLKKQLLSDSGPVAIAIFVCIAIAAPLFYRHAIEAHRRNTAKNNLKQLGLALHNYHKTYRVQTPVPRGDQQ
ncbi:DUF1559 domain-containing protein [bacterium]|nr:DUF1559 domain-containing protein [bacterium]